MSSQKLLQAALHQFNQSDLFDAGINLFSTMGYNTKRQNRLDDSSRDGFKLAFVTPDDLFDEKKALLADWQQIELLFQLTQAEVINQASLFDMGAVDRSHIEAYLFWAIDLTTRKNDDGTSKLYTRTELSQATRELNRLFPMPCLVIFRHDERLTLAVIDRRLHKRDQTRDVLEKVTLIKDIALEKTHPGHLSILEDLRFEELFRGYRVDSFVALHRAWQKTLDTSLLNKRFYEELFTWYLWAKSHPGLWFPKPAKEILDNDAYRSVTVIRLLTRLMFVWFVKEKGLVPDELFNRNDLKQLLRDFEPESDQSTDFYRAILQNLFFATLNTSMTKDVDKSKPKWEEEIRQFVHKTKNGLQNQGEDDGDQTKYRYEDCFIDSGAILQMFENVPFLNGGLFECLDYPEIEDADGSELRYDGFSMTEKKQARVPNQLFFGEYEPTDLVVAEMGGKLRKGLKLKGIVDILRAYKFTITENTPLEEEVALDPELLGKVFENLLASYNPETKVTARKQTGSFYTPREIVNYMVDESIKAYLRPFLPDEASANDQLIRLFNYVDTENPFVDSEPTTEKLIEAISDCKILDPACGSGAFPMGILHRMVHLLGKLDPENERWRKLQRKVAIRETEKAFQMGDRQQREDRLKQINDAFENNASDYGRKLFLIENCIYGVDIQQIAVQIAKLRFFISLIVDQRVKDEEPNRNVMSMPNLETKFVAADTLVSLNRNSQTNIFGDSDEVIKIENELQDLRQEIFFIRKYKEKKSLKEKEELKRNELKNVLERFNYPESTARKISEWNPFNIINSADFFDANSMFGVNSKSGFDIIIGNPPYALIQNLSIKESTLEIYQAYFVAQYKVDLYHLFIQRAIELCNDDGFICYITSNSFLKNKFNSKLREYIIAKTSPSRFILFYKQVFENASVDIAIFLLSKNQSGRDIEIFDVNDDFREIKENNSRRVDKISIKGPEFAFKFDLNEDDQQIIDSMNLESLRLGDVASTYFGIQTYDRNSHVSKLKSSASDFLVIDGTNVKRYFLVNPSEYVDFRKENIKSGGKSSVYSEDRIVVRQIGEYPYGTICPAYTYALNTIYNINIINRNFDIKYILSIINSKVVQYFWTKCYYDNKDTFPKIKKAPLESIPIKKISISNQHPFICLVSSIMFLRTQSNDNHLSSIATYFEQVIDGMVYELYFPDSLKAANCEVLKHLNNLPDVMTLFDDKSKIHVLSNFHEEIHDENHPIRKALFFMDTVEEVAIIEGKKK